MARRRPTVGTPATRALTRPGIPFTVHVYDHDPATSDYGLEAARALGIDPAAVLKTLLARVDDRPVVAVVPVAGLLDLKALASAHGGKRAQMAAPAEAERVTGYVVGGISPVGQRRPLPTYLDASVRSRPTVYVSAGRRGCDLGLAPADLLRATEGSWADLGRRR